jgi:hypothetical protein
LYNSFEALILFFRGNKILSELLFLFQVEELSGR